jgi:hypothetical protein
LSTAQAGARGVRDVALFYYPAYTGSIKASLQFSCNLVVIEASGLLFFQILTHIIAYDATFTNIIIAYIINKSYLVYF